MIALRLTNVGEMVLSASSATEGHQHSLAYIPGQALWGALAARIYADKKHCTRAFDLVHSGRVRTSPGFPITKGGQPAFPWPQCLQHPKHEGVVVDQDGSKVRRLWNMLDGPMDEGNGRVQTESPKSGWFLDGKLGVAKPGRRERGKAAIMAGGRRPADAQFFQYEMLEAGTEWIAWMDADDPADLDIVTSLLDGTTLQLGRSKRREYGGEVAVAVQPNWAPQIPRQERGTELVLWCLSDLALPDAQGGIDLVPEPASFGIPGFHGKLDRRRSLITTRRYAPFNAFLRVRDREHAVIEAGSVLVFTEAAAPADAFGPSIGLWRERGLGIVWANPAILKTGRKVGTVAAQADAQRKDAPKGTTSSYAPLENPTLLAVLGARAMRLGGAQALTDKADRLFADWRAMQLDSAEAGEEVPGASQWSRVAGAAENAKSLSDLRRALFDSPSGICVGTSNPGWQVLREKLRDLIGDPTKDPATPAAQSGLRMAMQRAARKMAAAARKDMDR